MAADAAAMRQVFTRLGFTQEAATSIVDVQGIDSLEELRILSDSDVENLCKVVRRPGGTLIAGGEEVPNRGISVSLRAENNAKLAAFWLRHRERISRPTAHADVQLPAVRLMIPIRESEKAYEPDETLPKINAKDWPKTMDAILEYLRTRLGERMIPLAYVVRENREVPASADDPSINYESVTDEMIGRASHGTPNAAGVWVDDPVYTQNKERVWDIIAQITREHPCWTYVKPAQRTRDGRAAYFGLYNHYLGPNNVDNMASMAEKRLAAATYKGETRRWDFERYVNVQKQQHTILEGLTAHGYAGIDERSKVRHLLNGIQTEKLDSVKTQILSKTELRNDFDACVTLYTDFIKEITPAGDTPTRQLSALHKHPNGKRDNSHFDNVEDRYYTQAEYDALSETQKRALALKRIKRGHVPGSKSSANPRKNSNPTAKEIKALTKTIAAVAKKVDILTDDTATVSDISTDETPKGSNRTNGALTRQKKNAANKE